jgi:copper chaperone
MTEFQIDDMTCSHCASTIARAVQSLDQAAKIEIDLAAERVRVESPVGPYKLAAAIRGAGFTPASAQA